MGSIIRKHLVCVAAIALLSTPNIATSDTSSDVIEELDVVEVLEVVEATNAAEGEGEDFSILVLIGRNHAAAVHLPIGLMAGVMLLELLSLFFSGIPLGKSGSVLSSATMVSFIPAALSGWLRSKEIYAANPAPELFFEHRNFIIAAVVIFTASLVLRVAKKDRLDGVSRRLYVGLLALSMLLLVLGGHHGGELVYGENFLPY